MGYNNSCHTRAFCAMLTFLRHSVVASKTVILMDLTDGRLLMGRKLHICAHPKTRHSAHTNDAPSLLLSVQSRVLVMTLVDCM